MVGTEVAGARRERSTLAAVNTIEISLLAVSNDRSLASLVARVRPPDAESHGVAVNII